MFSLRTDFGKFIIILSMLIIVTCTKGYKDKISNKLIKDTILMQHAFKVDEDLNFAKKRDIDVSFLGSLF